MSDPKPEWVFLAAKSLIPHMGCCVDCPALHRAADNLSDAQAAAHEALAAVIDDIRADALHKAATAYRLGGWERNPQARGDIATKRRQVEHAVCWLRNRAEDIERGERR